MCVCFILRQSKYAVFEFRHCSSVLPSVHADTHFLCSTFFYSKSSKNQQIFLSSLVSFEMRKKMNIHRDTKTVWITQKGVQDHLYGNVHSLAEVQCPCRTARDAVQTNASQTDWPEMTKMKITAGKCILRSIPAQFEGKFK